MTEEQATTEEVAAEEATTTETEAAEEQETPQDVATEVQEPTEETEFEIPEKYSKLSQAELARLLDEKDKDFTKKFQREAELRKQVAPLSNLMSQPQEEYIPQNEAEAAQELIGQVIRTELAKAGIRPPTSEEVVVGWFQNHADDDGVTEALEKVVERAQTLPEGKLQELARVHPEGIPGVLEDMLARAERDGFKAIRESARKEGKQEAYQNIQRKTQTQPESADSVSKKSATSFDPSDIKKMSDEDWEKHGDEIIQAYARGELSE